MVFLCCTLEQYIIVLFSKCLVVFRRQGGVLSPLLFALYLDDILHSLSVRKLEYSPDSIQLRYIIYADALVNWY